MSNRALLQSEYLKQVKSFPECRRFGMPALFLLDHLLLNGKSTARHVLADLYGEDRAVGSMTKSLIEQELVSKSFTPTQQLGRSPISFELTRKGRRFITGIFVDFQS